MGVPSEHILVCMWQDEWRRVPGGNTFVSWHDVVEFKDPHNINVAKHHDGRGSLVQNGILNKRNAFRYLLRTVQADYVCSRVSEALS